MDMAISFWSFQISVSLERFGKLPSWKKGKEGEQQCKACEDKLASNAKADFLELKY